MITDVNSENDILIAFENNDGETVRGLRGMLLNLRNDLDEAHTVVSRLKGEREPSKPIHLYGTNPS